MFVFLSSNNNSLSYLNNNYQPICYYGLIQHNNNLLNIRGGVPFLEPPRLNTRRRLSTRQSQDGSIISMSRRRSLSHCSSSSTIASSHPHRYSSVNVNQQLQEQQQINPINNQTPSMTSSTSEYGTLRRIPANTVQHQQPGFEPNTPRILVIPRGPKGFGFILRGARYADSMQLDFRPTLTIPALQFFEGVDMQGMAMRAGLRPGDFLLEINGVDVRAASHEQVVELIHQCGDTITLKVVTIDVDLLAREQQLQNTQHLQQQIYASSSGINYATVGRRNHSVPRLNGSSTVENPTNLPPPPPPPPQRDPSTTLSFGRRSFAASQFTAAVDVHNYSPNNSTLPCDVLPNSSVTFPQQQLTFVPMEQQTRCASVKLTKSVRRISAAELEHLMVQQGSSNSSDNNNQQKQQIVEQQNNNVGLPKKFTSAEMKRRKQQSVRNSNSNNNDQNQLMKSSISTPDLQAAEGNENNIYSENKNKIILRPKTPPPPPPQSLWKNSINLRGTEEQEQQQLPPPPSQLPSQNSNNNNTSAPIYASTVVVVPSLPQQNNKSGGGPPAPPPPPPINLLQKHSQPSTSSIAPTKPLQPKKQPETTNPAPASGISAETLRSVRLRPVKQTSPTKNENKNIQQNLKTSLNEGNEGGKIAPPIDFNSDLRSALARRRSKVRIVEETSESGGSGNEDNNLKNNKIVVNNIENNNGKGQQQQNVGNGGINNNGGGGGGILTGRYNGGLSLRESVLENVSGAAAKCGHVGGKMTSNTSSHSPPGGFIGTKKDSGYTSSRTSLEPSECGDCENNNGNGATIVASSLVNTQHSLPVKHRVNVLSQQLIDQQTSTQSPLLTGNNNKSFCPERDNNSIGSFLRIPAVDYDDQSENSSINSNNHLVEEQQPSSSSNQSTPKEGKEIISKSSIKEEIEFKKQNSGEFKQKAIKEWTCLDVCEWLEYLELSEHCSSFCEIKGIDLLYFDRSKYTALGVTRIAHRQKMEKSIKDFKEK
ncbi:unnamed protein product [Meloidogyne enterolobii]|uniref:Uncharacterized protein n=1 Tax=Meloidogyne enterolobii TaxID=390850 RepID=A0ACB0ZZ77_MELEN